MKDPRWFTYIVRCSDKSLYCGVTPDLERRVRMHKEGRGAKYTRGRGPVTLVWTEFFANKSEAMIAESEVKSLPRAKKELLIGDVTDQAFRERELLMWAHLSMNSQVPVPESTALKLMRSGVAAKACFARYSWAVATEEAVRKISAVGPIVEMGAGTGYWAWLLRRAGADVIAYDQFGRGSPHPVNPWNAAGRSFSKVVYGTPDSLIPHRDRALFLCWPPDHSSMALDCLVRWDGSTLAYVGDFRGVTAEERFYDRLRSEFRQISETAVPQWMGAKDSLTIWKRCTRRRTVGHDS